MLVEGYNDSLDCNVPAAVRDSLQSESSSKETSIGCSVRRCHRDQV